MLQISEPRAAAAGSFEQQLAELVAVCTLMFARRKEQIHCSTCQHTGYIWKQRDAPALHPEPSTSDLNFQFASALKKGALIMDHCFGLRVFVLAPVLNGPKYIPNSGEDQPKRLNSPYSVRSNSQTGPHKGWSTSINTHIHTHTHTQTQISDDGNLFCHRGPRHVYTAIMCPDALGNSNLSSSVCHLENVC